MKPVATRTVSFMRQCLVQRFALVAFAVGGLACQSPREQFMSGRVADTCDQQWPVCDRIVGCLLGDKSFIAGAFPGQNSVAVQLFEPSTVTVSFYLENTKAAGTLTVLNFYEERCRSRVRKEITGKSFVDENDKQGLVKRSAELTGVGDHLIEFESDARAQYLFKIDVVPTRLKDSPAL